LVPIGIPGLGYLFANNQVASLMDRLKEEEKRN
jgi:hypothetical protein